MDFSDLKGEFYSKILQLKPNTIGYFMICRRNTKTIFVPNVSKIAVESLN